MGGKSVAALVLGMAALALAGAARAESDPLKNPDVARIRDSFKVDEIALFDAHSQHAPRMGICAASIFTGLKWCVSGTAEEKKGAAEYIKTTGYNIDAESRIVYAISSRRSYPLKREEFDGIIHAIGERYGAGAAVLAFKKTADDGTSVDSLIAVWGGLRLVQLTEAEYALVESGGSLKRGHLVDHRFNLVTSAKQREPVYKIEGEAGYILHLMATSPDRADVIARVVYAPVFAPAPAKPAAESTNPLVTESVRRPAASPGKRPDGGEAAEAQAKRIEAERGLAAERLLREEAERKASEEKAARQAAEERARRAEAELKASEERRAKEEAERKRTDRERMSADERRQAEEADRKQAEEAARRAEARRVELERKTAEERRLKEEAERKAAAEKAARDEAERKAADEKRRKDEAERKMAEERAARADAERKALEERQRKEEAERKAAEESRRADARRAEDERKAAEEKARAEERRRKEEAERKSAEERPKRPDDGRKVDEERAAAERKRAQEESERAAEESRRSTDEQGSVERKAEAERLARERAQRADSWKKRAATAAQDAGAIWSFGETQDRVADERTLRSQTVFGGPQQGEKARLAVEVTFECTISGRDRRLVANARGFDRGSGVRVAFKGDGEGTFGVRTRFMLDDNVPQGGLLFRERQEDTASILEIPMNAGNVSNNAPRGALWLRHYVVLIEFPLVNGTVTATIAPHADNLRRVLEACAQ